MTLCVKHEGDVLPALAIFKGSRPLKVAQDVFVCTHSKAWMDEDLMWSGSNLSGNQQQKENVGYLFLTLSVLIYVMLSRKEINTVTVCHTRGLYK